MTYKDLIVETLEMLPQLNNDIPKDKYDGKCGWQKEDKGYSSSCGHTARHVSWHWQYCPYCGKELTRIRKDWL